MSLILSALALAYSSSVINPSPKLLEYSQDTLQLSVVFKKETEVTKEFRDIFDSFNKQGIIVDVYACDYKIRDSNQTMSEVCNETSPFYKNTAFPVYSATYYNSETTKSGHSVLFKLTGEHFVSEVQGFAREAPSKLLFKPNKTANDVQGHHAPCQGASNNGTSEKDNSDDITMELMISTVVLLLLLIGLMALYLYVSK
jgi:hypothetical protein